MADEPDPFWRFLWAGVVHHRQTGGIVPSQRRLIARMISPIQERFEGRVIELGAGTGALTVRLAARCPHARILACELNPGLAEAAVRVLRQKGLDRQVEVFMGSAETLLAEVASQGEEPPRYVVSGIPLGNLERAKVRSLLEAIWRVLGPNGMYIQFQHSLLSRRMIQARFPRVRSVPVFWNFPPAVVYFASR